MLGDSTLPASVGGLVVAITGAASGIGAGLASSFTAEGALVSVCDLLPIPREVHAAHTAAVDVTDADAVHNWIDEVVARFGRVDAVIANAGLARRGDLEHAVWTDIDAVIRVNLFGVLHSFSAAIPHMREQGGGSLVALVSRNAEMCPPGQIAYNASKAAVIATVRTLSHELRRSTILVNGLIPGPSRTQMHPEGTREPASCYPTARMLCTFRPNGPTGRTFFDGADYPIFRRFS